MNKLLKLISPMLISTLVSTTLIGCEGDRTNQTTNNLSKLKATQLKIAEPVQNININIENYKGDESFAVTYEAVTFNNIFSSWFNILRSGDKYGMSITDNHYKSANDLLSASIYDYRQSSYGVIAAYKNAGDDYAIDLSIATGDKYKIIYTYRTPTITDRTTIQSITLSDATTLDNVTAVDNPSFLMITKNGEVYTSTIDQGGTRVFKRTEIKVNTSLTESSLAALTSLTSEYNCVDLNLYNSILSARCDVGYISHSRYNSQQLEYIYHVGKQTTPISLDLSKCKPVNKELKDNSYNKDYDVKLVFGYSDSKQTAEWNEANNSKLVCQ